LKKFRVCLLSPSSITIQLITLWLPVCQMTEKSSFRWRKHVNSYQSKSSFDIVDLLLWGEKVMQKNGSSNNSFLIVDTFISYDLIAYKDNRLDLSDCFKTITWLQWFFYHLTHGRWVESNRSVRPYFPKPLGTSDWIVAMMQKPVANGMLRWVMWNCPDVRRDIPSDADRHLIKTLTETSTKYQYKGTISSHTFSG